MRLCTPTAWTCQSCTRFRIRASRSVEGIHVCHGAPVEARRTSRDIGRQWASFAILFSATRFVFAPGHLLCSPAQHHHHRTLESFLRRFSVSKARRLFEAAIKANPSHAESLGNLAVLLHGQPSTSPAMLGKIEGLYKRAVHADPANANNFSNFGLFLAEVNSSFAAQCCSTWWTGSDLP